MTKTTVTPADRLTSGDLGTTRGLYDEYVAQVEALATRQGWCSGYVRVAYSDASIPLPPRHSRRTPEPIISVADEFLSDTGKARKAELSAIDLGDLTVDQLQERITSVAVHAVRDGNIAQDHVAPILPALNLPGRFVDERTYSNYIAGSVYFSTPTAMNADQGKAMTDALNAAFTSVLESSAPAGYVRAASGSSQEPAYMERGTRSNRQWVWHPDAPSTSGS